MLLLIVGYLVLLLFIATYSIGAMALGWLAQPYEVLRIPLMWRNRMRRRMPLLPQGCLLEQMRPQKVGYELVRVVFHTPHYKRHCWCR